MRQRYFMMNSEDESDIPYNERCPTCESDGWRYGPGSIEDPLSNAAGGRPWRECWDCDGTGRIKIEHNSTDDGQE